MNAVILSLALSILDPGDGALPRSMSLAEPPQEEDLQRPEDGRVGVMEHVYRHSELEAGMLGSKWDSDLDLENDLGGYVRYGVGLGNATSVTLAYRHYDFTNRKLPAGGKEDVLLRAVLLGLAARWPVDRDFELSARIEAGFMRWESSGADLDDDTGPAGAAEGAVAVRLTEALRLRVGGALDWARTEFHDASSRSVLGFTLLVGFELGAR